MVVPQTDRHLRRTSLEFSYSVFFFFLDNNGKREKGSKWVFSTQVFIEFVVVPINMCIFLLDKPLLLAIVETFSFHPSALVVSISDLNLP